MELACEPLLDVPLEDCPLTFVDLETTGLSPRFGDRVCEVAAVSFRAGCEVARIHTLIEPCRPVSPGAMAVNGITAQMLAGAPRFAEIAARLVDVLQSGVVVAHNAPFDLSFLSRELALAGAPVPARIPVIDTLAIARRCFSFPSNSLGAIAARLDIRAVEHRALSDALATRAVLTRLAEILCQVHGPLNLGQLLELQGGSTPWPQVSDGRDLPVPPDLADALTAGSRLRLSYVSAQGKSSERLIDPIEVVARRGAVYLVAYCHLRQEQRTFRLDRIVAWQPG